MFLMFSDRPVMDQLPEASLGGGHRLYNARANSQRCLERTARVCDVRFIALRRGV